MTRVLSNIVRNTSVIATLALVMTSFIAAQVASPAAPAPEAPPPPLTALLKKTVVFLRTICLHDFGTDIDKVNLQPLQQMPQQQRLEVLQQLSSLMTRYQGVSASMAKLAPEDVARLKLNRQTDAKDEAATIAEITWRENQFRKMTSLTSDDVAKMLPAEIALLRCRSYNAVCD